MSIALLVINYLTRLADVGLLSLAVTFDNMLTISIALLPRFIRYSFSTYEVGSCFYQLFSLFIRLAMPGIIGSRFAVSLGASPGCLTVTCLLTCLLNILLVIVGLRTI